MTDAITLTPDQRDAVLAAVLHFGDASECRARARVALGEALGRGDTVAAARIGFDAREQDDRARGAYEAVVALLHPGPEPDEPEGRRAPVPLRAAS